MLYKMLSNVVFREAESRVIMFSVSTFWRPLHMCPNPSYKGPGQDAS